MASLAASSMRTRPKLRFQPAARATSRSSDGIANDEYSCADGDYPAVGADDDLEFEGRKIHCIESTVRLETAARKIELITWFSSGLGIVQQEQRTDEKLLVKVKLLEAKAK